MAILGVCAIGSAAYSMYMLSRARATLSWRPAEGKITWAMVEDRVRYRRRGRRTQYRAAIKYSYAIGAHEHTGDRAYYGAHEWRSSEAAARELVDRYPPGKVVRVFIDPARPKEAVLERGQDRTGRRWRMFALGFAAAAVVVYLFRSALS